MSFTDLIFPTLDDPGKFITGDSLAYLSDLPDNCVDFIFGSPPYEDVRSYEGLPPKTGQEWVDWMIEYAYECRRVCRGLCAFVVQGRTRKFRWSATPALLMAELHSRGFHLRRPKIYERDGIMGSGGPDDLKNRYEFIVCFTSGGRLPWSDNTAFGHPPKYPPGGKPSHRTSSDARVNKPRRNSKGNSDVRAYKPPKLANPGDILRGPSGGGHMGSKYAHEGEAPFPEWLADKMIRTYCPPNGLVCDPFSGSGTTVCAAVKADRLGLGFDIRQSQTDLALQRYIEEAKP